MTLPSTPPRAILFDLDGTLVDSLRDIAEALNECLDLLGLPAHPVPSYRFMVGEGVPKLCERALAGDHPRLLGRLIELARPRYRTRPLRHTRPYTGVPELIGRLHERGLTLGVLSNKPHDMTCQIIHALWPNGEFRWVQGYVAEDLRKPNPHHALEFCRHVGVAPTDAWLIGDTPTDAATAAAGGLTMIGVTWGFRTRADLAAAGARWIVDHPSELLWPTDTPHGYGDTRRANA